MWRWRSTPSTVVLRCDPPWRSVEDCTVRALDAMPFDERMTYLDIRRHWDSTPGCVFIEEAVVFSEEGSPQHQEGTERAARYGERVCKSSETLQVRSPPQKEPSRVVTLHPEASSPILRSDLPQTLDSESEVALSAHLEEYLAEWEAAAAEARETKEKSAQEEARIDDIVATAAEWIREWRRRKCTHGR
jgi:hypothetical protein